MSGNGHGPFQLARIYDFAQRMYSEVPYRYMQSGYSFPAWHYFIEVTRRCNLRCKMCQYIDWLENVPIQEQKQGELSTQEWLDVLAQIPRFSLITFTGGEAFVRKDFMALLSAASRRSRTHFISNSTMLPEERAEAVVALAPRYTGGVGFNFAGTSIEGPGDRHDEIRKMKGAWERSMAGIRLLRHYRDAHGKACPHIHVTTVIQRDNIDVLHLMPRMVKEAGADVLNLVTETRMHDLPGFGEIDPVLFKHDDIDWPHIGRSELSIALNRTLDEAKSAGIDVRLPRMPREDLLNYYDGRGLDLNAYQCRNAWNTLIIGRLGDAYPCWLQKVGNVREHSLKELWHNVEMREFRRTCQKHLFAPCPGCCFLEHRGEQTIAQPIGAGVAAGSNA